MDIVSMCRAAREASRSVANLPTEVKNRVLLDIASEVESRATEVLAANAQDVRAAEAADLPKAKLQRLALGEASLRQLCDGVRQVVALPDPVGQVIKDYRAASGLRVRRVRSPLGVIAMIYEARPGVTVDAFALCFKAGNACILKGGREAARSSETLAEIVRSVLARHRLPREAVTAFASADRENVKLLLQQEAYIDLVIPRGGTEIIRFVAEHSLIPTVQHYQGVCHIYVDASADLDMAERICFSAKVSAPATCNAAECVLVDRAIAPAFLPHIAQAWRAAGVEVRADHEARRLVPGLVPATDADWGREFLDLVIAVRVVDGLDEAVAHIRRYTSNHTESILTRTPAHAERFCREVQSSCVLVNASTRMNDGFALGLGAEIGISTSKVHAYGPMGLEELTTVRFVCEGEGQVR